MFLRIPHPCIQLTVGKGSRKFQKVKLEFATFPPLATVPIVSTVINLQMIKVYRRVCEGYKQRVLSKGLEHPIILTSAGGPGADPLCPFTERRGCGMPAGQGTLQSQRCVTASRPGLGPARESLPTADGQASVTPRLFTRSWPPQHLTGVTPKAVPS